MSIDAESQFSTLVARSLTQIVTALSANEAAHTYVNGASNQSNTLSTNNIYSEMVERSLLPKNVCDIDGSSAEIVGQSFLFLEENSEKDSHWIVFSSVTPEDSAGFDWFRFMSKLPDLSDIRLFVAKCYDIFFGRPVDEEGLAIYASLLARNTITQRGLIRILLQSPERSTRVGRLLCVQYPSSKLNEPIILSNTLLRVTGSNKDAPTLKLDLSSSEILGRAILFPSYAHKDATSWLIYSEVQENSVCDGNLFRLLKRLPEDLDGERFVTKCYEMLLDRAADDEGLANYVPLIANGALTSREFIRILLDSPEGLSRSRRLLILEYPNVELLGQYSMDENILITISDGTENAK